MTYNTGWNVCCTHDDMCDQGEFCQFGPGCEPPDWWNDDSYDMGDFQMHANGGTCIPIPPHAIAEVRWPFPYIVHNEQYDMHPGGLRDPESNEKYYPPWYRDAGVNYADECTGQAGDCTGNGTNRLSMNGGEDYLDGGYGQWIANRKPADYWIGINEGCRNSEGVAEDGTNTCADSFDDLHQYWELGLLSWWWYYGSGWNDWRDGCQWLTVSDTYNANVNQNERSYGFPRPENLNGACEGLHWVNTGTSDDLDEHDVWNDDPDDASYMPLITHMLYDDGDGMRGGSCSEMFNEYDPILTGRQPDGSADEDTWAHGSWDYDAYGGYTDIYYPAIELVVGGKVGYFTADSYPIGNIGTEEGGFDYSNGDYYVPGHCAYGKLDRVPTGGSGDYRDAGWTLWPIWGLFGWPSHEADTYRGWSEDYLTELVQPSYAGYICLRLASRHTTIYHNSGEMMFTQVRIGNGWQYIIEFLGQIPGCTDSDANNYNPNATFDDGSCDYAGGDEDFDTGQTGDVDVCPDISAMNFGAAGGGAYQGWEGTDQDISTCQYVTCLHPLAKNFLQAIGATDGPRFLSLNVLEKLFNDGDFSQVNQGQCEFDFTDDPIGFVDVPSLWTAENRNHHPYGNWDGSFTKKWQTDSYPGDGWPYLYLEGQTYYQQFSDENDMFVSQQDIGYGVLTDGLWGGSLIMWDDAYGFAQVANANGGPTPPLADISRNYIDMANATISYPAQSDTGFSLSQTKRK